MSDEDFVPPPPPEDDCPPPPPDLDDPFNLNSLSQGRTRGASVAPPPPPLPADSDLASMQQIQEEEETVDLLTGASTVSLVRPTKSHSISQESPNNHASTQARAGSSSVFTKPSTHTPTHHHHHHHQHQQSTSSSSTPPSTNTPTHSASPALTPMSTPALSSNISSLTAAADIASSSSKTPSFANSLFLHFPQVSVQVESGCYAAKRIGSVLKKICVLQEEYAKGILKVLQHENTKGVKLEKDGMKGTSKAWSQIQNLLEDLATSYSNDATEVQLQVVAPLLEFAQNGEDKRKEIVDMERRNTLEMVKAGRDVQKGLSNTQKVLDEAKKVVAAAQADAGKEKKGFFSSLSKKFDKKPEQAIKDAAKAAQNYSAAVVSANTRQKKHHLVDLPTVFNEMETLERNRLEITKVRLNKYVTLQEQYYSDRKKITEKLRKIADSVSPANDMQQFTEDTLFEHGICTYPAPFNYEIACTPSDIEAGRLESINTNSVFHTTLDRCMELQKEKFPQLQVPRIVTTLTDAIYKLGGYCTEGIFRISIPKSELTSLHDLIESDKYEDILGQVNSPHSPACALKEWMRMLSDPIIPDNLYNQSIDLSKNPNFQPSHLLKVFDNLPPVNQQLILHLSRVVAVLSYGPNLEKTRMNVENCAIVFAPSFLRNPSDDPIKLLENSKFETKFTAGIFKALIERENFDAAKENDRIVREHQEYLKRSGGTAAPAPAAATPAPAAAPAPAPVAAAPTPSSSSSSPAPSSHASFLPPALIAPPPASAQPPSPARPASVSSALPPPLPVGASPAMRPASSSHAPPPLLSSVSSAPPPLLSSMSSSPNVVASSAPPPLLSQVSSPASSSSDAPPLLSSLNSP